MASIETEKFQNMVRAIGSDTLASIANAGPEMQVRNELHYYRSCMVDAYSKSHHLNDTLGQDVEGSRIEVYPHH